MLENFLQAFNLFPQFNVALGAGIFIFARFLAFANTAPILSRKDIPMMAKICFSLIMTVSFVGILSPEMPPPGTSLILGVVMNGIFGATLGFIANTIFSVIQSAGDMVNIQMGLSSSVMFDPSSREQTTVMGKFFGFLGTVIFIHIGGMYWLFSAFERGFKVFPIYAVSIPLDKVIPMDYLMNITGSVLFVGLQVAAPILIATLAMDVILGIISKIAPQVNVFQLSFLFKPVIGVAIIIITLPVLINVITDYFSYYSVIF